MIIDIQNISIDSNNFDPLKYKDIFDSNLRSEDIKIGNKTKIWLLNLLRVIQKDGKKLKYKNYLKYVIFNLIKKYKDLDKIFINFYEILFFPFYFRTRVVAGRKVIIPIILKENKDLMFISKYIKSVLGNRTEKKFQEKLLNELIDISLEKGLTIKKISQLYLDVKKNFVNLRFIRTFKK